ncbi:MAG: hypothetical protein FWG61_03395 [Firmicutes bacterium]|nr:hypothetical protein [Bacillota bacterium]
MTEIIEKAAVLDDRVMKAKESEYEMEQLIKDFGPFLQSRVAKYSLRSDYERREELFSVAMIAFYEAIKNFDAAKGHFFPFANRVICTRIIDQIRTIYRHEGKTVYLEENVDGESTSQSAAMEQIAFRTYYADQKQEKLLDEIEQFKLELSDWGITMESLAKNSPKHRKLRDEYKMAIKIICQTVDIVQTIQIKRYFPIKAVAEVTGLSPKTLERARTFILASLIIRIGDYNLLADYVDDSG